MESSNKKSELKLCLVVSVCVAGILMAEYGLDFEARISGSTATDDRAEFTPFWVLVKQSCLFWGLFYVLLTIGSFYTWASGGFKRAVLKILDWCLIGFCLLLIPPFFLLDVPPLFWILLVLLPALAARFITSWLVKRSQT